MLKCDLRDYQVRGFSERYLKIEIECTGTLSRTKRPNPQRMRKERLFLAALFLFDVPNISFVPSARLCEANFSNCLRAIRAHIASRKGASRSSATFAARLSFLRPGLLEGGVCDERNRFFADLCGILSFAISPGGPAVAKRRLSSNETFYIPRISRHRDVPRLVSPHV